MEIILYFSVFDPIIHRHLINSLFDYVLSINILVNKAIRKCLIYKQILKLTTCKNFLDFEQHDGGIFVSFVDYEIIIFLELYIYSSCLRVPYEGLHGKEISLLI